MILYRQDDGGGSGAPAVTIIEAAAPAAEPAGGRNTLMDDLLKERNKRKEAEKQLADAQAKVTAAETAQLSENEQLKTRLAAAEATAAEATAKAAKATKSGLVRSAAKDFHDPEDAVALLESRGLLADIDDSADADRAVKVLATDRPHLVKAGGAGGAPLDMQQILRDGLGVTQQGGAPAPSAGDSSTYTFAEMQAMSQAQMGEVMSTPEGAAKVQRSMASLKAA